MIHQVPEWIGDDSQRMQRNEHLLRTFFESPEGASIEDIAAEHLGFNALGQVGSDLRRDNTRRAYQSDQRLYIAAAIAAGIEPLLPTITFWIAYFVAFAANHSIGSVIRHACGIANLFFRYGLPSPTRTFTHQRLVRRLSKETKRSARRAKALYGEDAKKLVRVYRSRSLCDRRDKAICLIGITRGLRSASITALALEDISFEERGVLLSLRYEKTSRSQDPVVTGTPHSRGHKYCMVCSIKHLVDDLTALGIREGPLFRGIDKWGYLRATALVPTSVTGILRRGLVRAGIEAPQSYSSHSFRHGVVTAARLKGWSDEQIMMLTLHRSHRGLEPYLRGADTWYNSVPECIVDHELPTIQPANGWKHV